MKTVMGEYEMLKHILHTSNENEVYSFVQETGFTEWKIFLEDIIHSEQKEGTVFIRTTEPYSELGESAHYISFILFRTNSTMVFYNSESTHSENLRHFIEQTDTFVRECGWSFIDCSPTQKKNTFQVHAEDTFCQSWSAFILQYVSNWEPTAEGNTYYHKKTGKVVHDIREIFPVPKPKDSYRRRVKFILNFLKQWILETEDRFDFTVKHQLEVQYDEFVDNKSFQKEINNAVSRYLYE